MSQEHDKMVKALKEIVVAKLREKGFKGSFPHFRRLGDEKIDLLTFQFDKWGGGFVIEISMCRPDGIRTHWGEHIPPNKVNAWHIHPDKRFRLQPRLGNSRHEWFRYEKGKSDDEFRKIAIQALPFLDAAEKWWKEEKVQ